MKKIKVGSWNVEVIEHKKEKKVKETGKGKGKELPKEQKGLEEFKEIKQSKMEEYKDG